MAVVWRTGRRGLAAVAGLATCGVVGAAALMIFAAMTVVSWLARSAWAQSVFVGNIGQPDGGIRVRREEAPASGRDGFRAQFPGLWLPLGQSVAQVVAALAPQPWRMAGRTAAQVFAALTLVLGLGIPAMAQSPTVNIEGVPSTSERAFTATFVFSENVTGFALADITVGNGAASAFTGADGERTYTALITPDGERVRHGRCRGRRRHGQREQRQYGSDTGNLDLYREFGNR